MYVVINYKNILKKPYRYFINKKTSALKIQHHNANKILKMSMSDFRVYAG